MKLFKTIDDRFVDIGFTKVEDNEYIVVYERYDEKYKYTQVLAIVHKSNGNHIIQSYDKDHSDKEGIGCTCVGLTYYEARLALKKMAKKGWKSKNKKERKNEG